MCSSELTAHHKLLEIIRSTFACVRSTHNGGICDCENETSLRDLTTDCSQLWSHMLAPTFHDTSAQPWSAHLHCCARAILDFGFVGNAACVHQAICDQQETQVQIRCSVDVVEKTLSVSLLDMWLVVYPLASYLVVSAIRKHQGRGGRYVAGIAGSAGAGKSSICIVLKRLIDWMSTSSTFPVPGPSDQSVLSCSVVGQDAYHLTNSELRRRSLERFKGLPITFDIPGLVAAARKLSGDAGREPVLLPVYSRELHDPVPDQTAIQPAPCVVLFEGVNVLSTSGDYGALRDLWDLRVHLHCPESLGKERAVSRKMKSGLCRAAAAEHYDRVDGVNRAELQRPENRDNCDVRVDVACGEAPLFSSMSTAVFLATPARVEKP